MTDQAEQLRRMMFDAESSIDGSDCALPPMVVVTGAKGGVGATTVAVNLAVALSLGGQRTALVDAALHADAAHLAGVDTSQGWSTPDVASGICDAADALRPGPGGISLVAGLWAPEVSPDRSPQSCRRLLRQLATLESRIDAIVIDSGSGMTRWIGECWQHAGLVLLVTTPDDVAVMDTYATIKRGVVEAGDAELRVLVNQYDSAGPAASAERRIATACQRFLGRTIERAPRILRNSTNSYAGMRWPRTWEAPSSPFARSVNQLGRFAADVLSQRRAARPTRDRQALPRPEYENSRC